MSHHEEILKTVCRLCRRYMKKNEIAHKTVAFYSTEIFSLFKTTLSDDIDTIHPKYICCNCRCKMQNVNKSTEQSNLETFDIAVFEAHNDTDCKLCKQTIVPHTYSVIKVPHCQSLSKSSIDIVAMRFNFQLLMPHNELYLTTYYLYTDEIQLQLFVTDDYRWKLSVFGKMIPEDCCLVNKLPLNLNVSNLDNFFSMITQSKVCPGNDDYVDLIDKKMEMGSNLEFLSKNKEVKAYIENKTFVNIKDCKTIRVVNCSLIIINNSLQCDNCTAYRPTLTVMRSRNSSSKHSRSNSLDVSFHPNTPNIFLKRQELTQKCNQLQGEKRRLEASLRRTKNTIEKLVKQSGVGVDEQAHNLLSNIMNKNDDCCNFDMDSPQYLLWQQQKKQASYKNSRSMRWHPLMIRWCLSIYIQSPGNFVFILFFILSNLWKSS